MHRRARSAPAGLLGVAEQRDTALIVLGSSPAGGVGHGAFGAVAGRLLHSSPVPIALAPAGFHCAPAARVSRVSAEFGASAGSEDLVLGAAGVAARVGAALRIVTFAVRARTAVTAGAGLRAEDAVVREWATNVEQAQRVALSQVAELPAVPHPLHAVVGYGHDWNEALADVEWADGDVLVVGSSSVGPVARVFLGSRSSKIVRHSPVPVVVVPRGAVTELAERAGQSPESGQPAGPGG